MIDPRDPENIFNYANMLNEARKKRLSEKLDRLEDFKNLDLIKEAHRKRLREELDAEVQALKTLELIKEAENIANKERV